MHPLVPFGTKPGAQTHEVLMKHTSFAPHVTPLQRTGPVSAGASLLPTSPALESEPLLASPPSALLLSPPLHARRKTEAKTVMRMDETYHATAGSRSGSAMTRAANIPTHPSANGARTPSTES